MKAHLKKIFLDMIPVVLGVLIALFISNWQQNRSDKKFLASVMNSIELELEENKVELESRVIEHESLLDTLSFYMENDSVRIVDIIGKVNGMRMATIKNTSWKSFMNWNIQLVDPEKISLLTDIEEHKSDMTISTSKIVDFIYSRLESTDESDKLRFLLMTGDFQYLEEELLEAHVEFLEMK